MVRHAKMDHTRGLEDVVLKTQKKKTKKETEREREKRKNENQRISVLKTLIIY